MSSLQSFSYKFPSLLLSTTSSLHLLHLFCISFLTTLDSSTFTSTSSFWSFFFQILRSTFSPLSSLFTLSSSIPSIYSTSIRHHLRSPCPASSFQSTSSRGNADGFGVPTLEVVWNFHESLFRPFQSSFREFRVCSIFERPVPSVWDSDASLQETSWEGKCKRIAISCSLCAVGMVWPPTKAHFWSCFGFCPLEFR